jgi:fucose 4-O-acetylase-like acetyltransferase
MKMRDKRVDAMRALAILSILLAHSGVKGIIFNVRCFDVPLMAFCLGCSYSYSSKNISYFNYVKKRANRLLIPAWIFLILLYVFLFIVDYLTATPFQFDSNYLIHSFYMDSGFSYAWIMRTFFFVSLMVPLLFKLGQKANTFKSIVGIVALLLVIQIGFIKLLDYIPEQFQYTYAQLVPLAFGYLPIVFLGIVLPKVSNKDLWKMIITFFISLIASFYFLGASGFNTFKYPPRLPYVLYGCLCIVILWVILLRQKRLVDYFMPVISYFSTNSQNIYFIHVFYIYIYNFYLKIPILDNWFFNFAYLLIMTMLTLTVINQGKVIIKARGLKKT